jgi:hypothetical protein
MKPRLQADSNAKKKIIQDNFLLLDASGAFGEISVGDSSSFGKISYLLLGEMIEFILFTKSINYARKFSRRKSDSTNMGYVSFLNILLCQVKNVTYETSQRA